jgi:hypothetical protein
MIRQTSETIEIYIWYEEKHSMDVSSTKVYVAVAAYQLQLNVSKNV